MVAADGGLLASFQSNVKASVFISSFSFAMYVTARLAARCCATAAAAQSSRAIPAASRPRSQRQAISPRQTKINDTERTVELAP